ncbi:glycosyltransferase family 39 protein [Geotalea sp. SG265]|uniref:ArnT family glycosyltransferase n=1 Tax=Geotalea sp. SG265 TaxID=2922867 RepID=UPI001FB00C86|nr:glycosyltransferase family 39 protein [Geotalea sp. SG265]
MNHTEESTPSNGLRPVGQWPAKEILLVTVLVVATFLYRAYFIRTYDVMSADGTSYSTMGKAFLETWDPHVFGTIAPPLYSIFIGAFDLVFNDLELSARLVSVVFSTLTLIPLYLMAREAFGRTAAVTTALLFATLPFIHGMSGIDITEPTYTCFVVAGAYVFWRGVMTGRLLLYAAAGALLGAAYLARPEAFIACVALTLFFFGRNILGRNWSSLKRSCLLLVCFWCGFLILASPYMWYLHDVTGKWQLSGKSGVNSEVIREYRGTITTNDQKFRLDDHGNFTEGKGQSLFKIMRDEPDLFWGNIWKNIRELPPAFNGVFQVYLWPFILVGLMTRPRRGTSLDMHLILLGILAPLAIYLLFFVQPRGFYAYVPGLLVWAGAGGKKISDWIGSASWPFPLVLPVVVALSAYYVFTEIPRPKPPYNYNQDMGRYDDKQIGRRLRSIIPENVPIMTRSGRIAFYAGKKMIIPPQADYPDIIAYARKNRAGYLIATTQLVGMRPQLQFLFSPILEPTKNFTPPPELELRYMGLEPGGLPYLVYRIKDRD